MGGGKSKTPVTIITEAEPTTNGKLAEHLSGVYASHDIEAIPPWCDVIINRMQTQINDLRDAHTSLKRDVEAMRKHNATLEQKVATNHKELSQKVNSVLQHGELVGRDSHEDDNSKMILATGSEMSGAFARAARVFCQGPILDAVQRARIFPDSKTFVDMPLKADPEVVLQAFEDLPLKAKDSPDDLQTFVDKWFGEVGSDFEDWVPNDMIDEPTHLMSIQNPDMRLWALEINKLWPILGRKPRDEVAKFPQRTTLLPRTFAMMVPGGRFREMYYWDTYWLVKGLVICDMITTAKGLVDSLIERVRNFGFIPNGGRIYYLDRSQPPMLTAMVEEIFKATRDREWLESALPILEKEYRFWMDPKGGRLVELPKLSGERQVLNIFRSVRSTPRPESYYEDIEVCKEAVGRGRNANEVYEAICSAAETGWDFSTRWLDDSAGRVPLGTANLSTMDTCHVLPCCLNSILYNVEETLEKFHKIKNGGECDMSRKYKDLASARERTMNAWLWTGDAYRDYRLDVGAHSRVVSISDWAVPLWAGLKGPGNQYASEMIGSLKRAKLLNVCGCATTAVDSCGHTQWDAPNAWPPMIQMLIAGLDKVDGAEALADTLCDTWLRTNYITWQRTGFMHEKYDVFEPGRFGSGGEYEPQVGFGWTNGVALELLVRRPRVSKEGKILPRDESPRRNSVCKRDRSQLLGPSTSPGAQTDAMREVRLFA